MVEADDPSLVDTYDVNINEFVILEDAPTGGDDIEGAHTTHQANIQGDLVDYILSSADST